MMLIIIMLETRLLRLVLVDKGADYGGGAHVGDGKKDVFLIDGSF